MWILTKLFFIIIFTSQFNDHNKIGRTIFVSRIIKKHWKEKYQRVQYLAFCILIPALFLSSSSRFNESVFLNHFLQDSFTDFNENSALDINMLLKGMSACGWLSSLSLLLIGFWYLIQLKFLSQVKIICKLLRY